MSSAMDARAAAAYQDMAAAAEADGVRLRPLSGYRTGQTQTANYNASIERYLAQGFSREEARRLTGRYYALPGTSEHEAGLAMDIGDADAPGTNIVDSFEDTRAFEWLQHNAKNYGFVLRYPRGYEEVTGIAYEPWHYRYVGANHARRMEEERLVLEEYTGLYGAQWQDFDER